MLTSQTGPEVGSQAPMIAMMNGLDLAFLGRSARQTQLIIQINSRVVLGMSAVGD